MGGFVFKKSKKIKERWFETYGLEIMNVKSNLEVRTQLSNGATILFGKSNYLYAIRLQYGRDIVLFSKAAVQGAEVKACFAAGPSIGVVAPYYIKRQDDNGYLISEQYDASNPQHAISSLADHGDLLEGIGQSKIQLGLNLKAALNFEIGVSKRSLSGFETGFLVDAYSKKIPLVPTGKNPSVFPTVFLTIFYGLRK
ncbi:MAG: hypothetical protein CRN43_00590 [Candidatus Nephrothrix sp. EaCA]|nr:MAG: hypothetical protein CRN43_00590 [Candidatus Nephrothrix sp. EaCA]